MHWTTLGIDVAKQDFQLYGVDERDRVMVQKRVGRSKVRAAIGQLPPLRNWAGGVWECVVLGPAVSRAWDTVKLISPQFVKPYGAT